MTQAEHPQTEEGRPLTQIVWLVETHGDSDDIVREWRGQKIVVTRGKVQIDGATVALYEDAHYYPTRDPRHPSLDDLDEDAAGNEVWIGATR